MKKVLPFIVPFAFVLMVVVSSFSTVACDRPDPYDPDPDSAMDARVYLPPDSLQEKGDEIFK